MATGLGLWPHQIEAVDSALRALGGQGRTTVVAACGTGKTYMGAAVASELGPRRSVLVVVPTIELLAQTLAAYQTVLGGRLGRVVAACSDQSLVELALLAGVTDVEVTTNASVLADAVRGQTRVTVFSTYASLPVVSAAHAGHGLAAWDLVVIDEAHRTTGRADGPWKAVHHDTSIPAQRRLYMTATPRVALTDADTIVSMSDTSVYGEVSYRLPFSRAIGMGLLADYRIVVPVITDEEVHRLAADPALRFTLGGGTVEPSLLAGQIAVLRAMSQYDVRRAISYHHRVADAKRWAHTLPAAAGLLPGMPLDLWAGHVSGAQPPQLRRRILDRLGDPGPQTVVVSNAKVLNEGVDVAAVDAVVFSRPRDSAIDTVQALGRALRNGGRAGKVATIVVPLLISSGESPEAALEGSAWAPVWQVLRALRDHDDRLDEELRVMRMGLGEGRLLNGTGRDVKLPEWFHVQGVEIGDAFAQAITIKAVRSTTPSWDEYFGAARAYADLHGHLEVSSDWITQEGLRLGSWLTKQRIAFNTSDLAADRTAALDNLGIIWDQLETRWMRTYSDALRFKEEFGHLNPPEGFRSGSGVVLAVWLVNQRIRRKQGKLSAEREALLNQLGLEWEPDPWMQRYLSIKEFSENRGSLLRLPAQSPQRIWLEGQQAAIRYGKLSAQQIQLLEDIGYVSGSARDALWQRCLDELRAFVAEEGHFSVPADVVTVDDIKLASWSRSQRSRHRRGSLSPEQFQQLDRLGYPWDPTEEQWLNRYQELRAFYTTYGHLNVQHVLGTSPLTSWLYQQRKKYGAGALAGNHRERLDQIDPLWADDRACLLAAATRDRFRLTDRTWNAARKLIPPPARASAAWETADLRAVIDAIIWKLSTGVRWDDIPADLGAHQTISAWWRQWDVSGAWAQMTEVIRATKS